jgi:hypothetical protein
MTPQLYLNKTFCQSSINTVYDFSSFMVDNVWVLGRLAKSIWWINLAGAILLIENIGFV